MGAFLDKPITDKTTEEGEGNGIKYGMSSMQGWRVEMEDAHTAIVSIDGLPDVAFFAVFDGHGGATVSQKSATELLPAIMQTPEFKNTAAPLENRLQDGLRAGYFAVDRKLRKLPGLENLSDRSGSTAIGAFVSPTHIVIGNCGDSRAVLCRGGKAHFSTKDHKPTDETEKKRVNAAGGYIEIGRVCGNLAVSRALGDYTYKDKPHLPDEEQVITALADMTSLRRSENDEFLMLGCDGIWDVVTNEQACEFVTNQLKGGFTPAQVCERMLEHCLLKGSKDNMSFCVVVFEGAPKKEEGFVVPELGMTEEEKAAESNAVHSLLHSQLSMRSGGFG